MASWAGLTEVYAALAKTMAGADAAAKSIVTKGAAVVERDAKNNFSGAHRKGEPHVGGNQPNIVTGTLRRSITHTPVTRTGLGEYTSRVGPTVIYGRRVELGYSGGGGGRGHQATRAFPYFGPGVETARRELAGIAAAEWARFVRF